MPHLNLDLDYFEHRKVKRLVGLLGKGSEVLPIKLWRYIGKYHSEDGELTGYSEQEIATAAEWWGNPVEFVQAMVTVGFLEKEGNTYVAHDWVEKQGHIAALRERGRQNAEKRWQAIRNPSSNASSIHDDCSSIAIPSNKTPTPFVDFIPSHLNVPEFHAAWVEFANHRSEIKHRLTPTAAKKMLGKLAKFDLQTVLAAIEKSIANGWQGCFPESVDNPKRSANSRSAVAAKGREDR